MPEAGTYDAFVSYSHRDAAWVREELLPRLEAAGIQSCIDVRDFAIGAPILEEIERCVLHSAKTILVLTPDYLASEWAELESVLVQTLDPVARTRRMLPVLLRPCEVPLRIRAFNYVDFTQGPDLEAQFQRLIAAITPG